jgi:Rnl2 family RNA ligase
MIEMNEREFIVKVNPVLREHKCEFKMVDEFPENSVCRICGKSIMADDVLPEPEKLLPLSFVGYSSIEGVHNQKMIDNIVDQGFSSGVYSSWVALNKIHGANFAVHASAEEIKFARRTGFLEKDEAFYGYERAKLMLSSTAMSIQNYYGATVTIFMELFGGSYPHETVKFKPSGTRVQSGVWYTPYNDVRCIDIMVNGEYIDYPELVTVCKVFNLRLAPELARGSLEQMLALNSVFMDPLYKEYGLPEIPGNESEGFVLRPVKEGRLHNGKRVILKHKNPKFQEKVRAPKKPREPMSKVIENALEESVACITEARLNNILSHGDKFTQKDFGRLQGLIVQDIMKEEDENPALIALEKEDDKAFKKYLSREVAEFLRPRFAGIIEEE